MGFFWTDENESHGAFSAPVVMRCPVCKGVNLHHTDVEVFMRRGEDACHGLHTRITNDGTTVDSSMEANPSRRRDGLIIHFRCEAGCHSELHIAQHKGETQLSWGKAFVPSRLPLEPPRDLAPQAA